MDERLWLGAICGVGLIGLVRVIASWRLPGSVPGTPALLAKGGRVLRQRTPKDCGLCRAEVGETDGNEAVGRGRRAVLRLVINHPNGYTLYSAITPASSV